MKYIKLLLITTFLFISCSENNNSFDSDTEDETLRIATFNIAWLGDGYDDLITRTDEHYKELANIISELDADVVALQEIENKDALILITKYLKDYSIIMSDQYYGKQNPAVIYNNSVEAELSNVYEEIAVSPGKTRPGLAINCKKNNFDCEIIVVHFKSTSRYDSTEQDKIRSREIRLEQSEALSKIVENILAEGSEDDILIAGDFNDYPGRENNNTLYPILNNQDLFFLTGDMMSCKYDYWHSIDHIVGTEEIKNKFLQNSVFMYDIDEVYPEETSSMLSDHCPVVISINIKGEDIK